MSKMPPGVACQYGNETGKIDNCQVGVFLAFASSRVVAAREGLPGPEVWWVIRSHAPPEADEARWAWLTAARWPVERAADGKEELKMNQHAMRS